MPPAISVENLSKCYRLGVTHSTTLRDVVHRTASRLFGRQKTLSRLEIAGDANSRTLRNVDNAEFWALRDVSFEIQHGEIIGVIGKNGAGKSTLLKILSRITSPTRGRIRIHGRVASLLEIGTGFHAELTGRENIYLNGAFLGMTKGEVDRRFDEIVDFSEIEAFIDTPVKRYSSGMYVRLAFGVAANLDPEILIVDEVLAVGDAAFQKKCLGKMGKLGHEGRTVVFVSHNMAAVRQLTSECIVMSEGRVAFRGPSVEAIDRYLERENSANYSKMSVVDMPRPDWCGDRSIEIVDVELRSPSNLRHQPGRDICIEITVHSSEVVRSFEFGVTLYAGDATALASSFSDPVGPLRPTKKQSFQLTIPDPGLAPGQYSFAIGITRNGRMLVDVIHDVLHFSVLPDGRVPVGSPGWNPSWGYLRMPVETLLVTGSSSTGVDAALPENSGSSL